MPRPNLDEVRAHLDLVFASNAGNGEPAASEAEKDELVRLYTEYEELRGRPSANLLGASLRPEILRQVHDAYRYVRDQGRLAKLRSALKLAIDSCPYCGFGEIRDLDHHLQKAIYRAFSIFPLNLVPSCATCNRRKPSVPDADPAKHLLNAYLEDPTGHEFLVAVVSLGVAGGLDVKFSVRRCPGMPEELFQRLSHHLDQFNLNERLRAQVNILFSNLEVALEEQFEAGGAEAVSLFLRRSAEKSAGRVGFNDWRSAVLWAAAASNAFCDGGFKVALGFADPASLALPVPAEGAV